MRKIKFRVWDKEHKYMHRCGDDIHDNMIFPYEDGAMCYYNLQNGEGSIPDGTGAYELMQYTGLHDINGKEIFEGDIVSFDDCTSTESGYWEQSCMGVVEWCNETVSFEVTNRLSAKSYEVLDECVIVGNIYENSELLKAGESNGKIP